MDRIRFHAFDAAGLAAFKAGAATFDRGMADAAGGALPAVLDRIEAQRFEWV